MSVLHRVTLAVLLALPVFGGCSDEGVTGLGDEASVSVLVEVAAAGAVIPVRFANPTSSSFGVNTCDRRAERREGSLWVPIPEGRRICAGATYEVRARNTLVEVTDVPAEATPGEYRLRFTLSLLNGTYPEIVTPPFRVE